MRLAIVAIPEQTIPPKNYGGIERIVDIVVRRLIGKGHTVDLYAGEGSLTPATSLIPARAYSMSEEGYLTQQVYDNRDKYDCVIDATANHLSGQIPDMPTVSLMLGDPLKRYPHDNVKNRIYGSKELADFYDCPEHPVLSNIIYDPPEDIPIGDGSGGYALYVGAIRQEKGLHIAAQACSKLGKTFIVAGPVKDEAYWNSIKGGCIHYGMLGSDFSRWELFGNASVFLHLTTFLDCDPLGPKEAMLCGTPVVAFASGGVISSVGARGGVVFEQDDACVAKTMEAISITESKSRQDVRDWILPKIDPAIYVDKLLEFCEDVIRGVIW